MYIQHVEFEVVPETFERWRPYLHNYLAAMARQPGGVSFRVLKTESPQHKFISIRVWLSKEDAERAMASPEIQLVRQVAVDGGFYAGKPAVWTECELLDMVWGWKREAFVRKGAYVDHIMGGVGPGKWDLWRPYARNFVSVIARQPGVVSHETFRFLADPMRFFVLRSFASREAGKAGPEFQPPAEMKLATVPAEQRKVYEGGPGTKYHACEVWDAVWGAAGEQAYDVFMRGLKPV
jgi:quinol monooxygenase YgiN